MRSVMFAPEVLDLFDCDPDRLMRAIDEDGFPEWREIPGEPAETLGWYRHEIEGWFADRIIRESQIESA